MPFVNRQVFVVDRFSPLLRCPSFLEIFSSPPIRLHLFFAIFVLCLFIDILSLPFPIVPSSHDFCSPSLVTIFRMHISSNFVASFRRDFPSSFHVTFFRQQFWSTFLVDSSPRYSRSTFFYRHFESLFPVSFPTRTFWPPFAVTIFTDSHRHFASPFRVPISSWAMPVAISSRSFLLPFLVVIPIICYPSPFLSCHFFVSLFLLLLPCHRFRSFD